MTLSEIINQMPRRFRPSFFRERCAREGIKVPCPFLHEEFGLKRVNHDFVKMKRFRKD